LRKWEGEESRRGEVMRCTKTAFYGAMLPCASKGEISEEKRKEEDLALRTAWGQATKREKPFLGPEQS